MDQNAIQHRQIKKKKKITQVLYALGLLMDWLVENSLRPLNEHGDKNVIAHNSMATITTLCISACNLVAITLAIGPFIKKKKKPQGAISIDLVQIRDWVAQIGRE